MSGYDFFSGFFGSLGNQMEEKRRREQEIQDEERQYQRGLSREEALAASRERLAIATEERRRKSAPPTQFETIVDGKRMRGLGTWNPETRSYDAYGDLTEVPPTYETFNLDGNVVQIGSDGSKQILGESDAGLRTRSANERAYSANALRKQEMSKPASPAPQKDLDAEIRREQRNAVKAAVNKNKGIYAEYGLRDDATIDQLRKAVEQRIRGTTPEAFPGYTEVFQDGTTAEIPSDAKPEQAAATNTAQIAELVAKVRASDPDARNASEADIIRYLKSEGLIK